MAKRLTPIERAIAGEPVDRRRRYEQRMEQKGMVRVTAMLPADLVKPMQHLAKLLRDGEATTEALEALLSGLGASERTEGTEGAPTAPERPEARL